MRSCRVACDRQHYLQQESPPAWTQEAYRPRRIKYYSMGYVPPIGVPPAQVWEGVPEVGYPHPGLMGGTRGGVSPGQVWPVGGGTQDGVPPCQGTPRPGQMGGTQGGVPPCLDLAGVPPYLDLAGVPPPPPAWTWLGYPPPPSWTWQGYPPAGVDWQSETITFPLVLRTRSVISGAWESFPEFPLFHPRNSLNFLMSTLFYPDFFLSPQNTNLLYL